MRGPFHVPDCPEDIESCQLHTRIPMRQLKFSARLCAALIGLLFQIAVAQRTNHVPIDGWGKVIEFSVALRIRSTPASKSGSLGTPVLRAGLRQQGTESSYS